MDNRNPGFTGSIGDLIIVVALLVGYAVIAAGDLRGTALGTIAGLVYVLILPGYAFVSAAFPERGVLGHGEWALGLRLVLAVGASLVIVPIVALALNFTPVGVHPVGTLTTIGGITLILVGIAIIRRGRTPAARRLTMFIPGSSRRLRAPLPADTLGGVVLNLALVTIVLVGVGAAGVAVTGSSGGSAFTYTEFSLLTANETGQLVADNYPTEFQQGEQQTLYVAVVNREGRTITYTVVTRVQKVGTDGRPTRTERLGRREVTIDAGDQATFRSPVEPPMVGTSLRLQYLLYRGDPPQNPTADNAYRHAHLWINVSRG